MAMFSFRPVYWIGLAIAVLTAGHLIGLATEKWWGWDRASGVLREFDLNGEANLAAWTESSLLLLCAVVALGLTMASQQAQDGHTRRWGIVAGALFAMTVDEAAQLHDLAAVPIREALAVESGSPLYFAWVIPAIFVLGGVAAYLVPLLMSLPHQFQTRLVVAVAIYFGGSVGFEMISGFAVAEGRDSGGYHLVTTVEEVLELSGSLLAFAALLGLLQRLRPTFSFQLAAPRVSAEVAVNPVRRGLISAPRSPDDRGGSRPADRTRNPRG